MDLPDVVEAIRKSSASPQLRDRLFEILKAKLEAEKSRAAATQEENPPTFRKESLVDGPPDTRHPPAEQLPGLIDGNDIADTISRSSSSQPMTLSRSPSSDTAAHSDALSTGAAMSSIWGDLGKFQDYESVLVRGRSSPRTSFYRCQHCGKSYKTLSRLNSHAIKHSLTRSSSQPTSASDVRSPSPPKFSVASSSVPAEIGAPPEPDPQLSSLGHNTLSNDIADIGTTHACAACGEIFEEQGELAAHLLTSLHGEKD
eukprot:c16927_g1_i1.p1 GENE.c16927_g1_i1~~c16927_g1_i1.p1  ORF type:complete len:257 (+),score=34.34 c16927_g1_i1:55-825(+)